MKIQLTSDEWGTIVDALQERAQALPDGQVVVIGEWEGDPEGADDFVVHDELCANPDSLALLNKLAIFETYPDTPALSVPE